MFCWDSKTTETTRRNSTVPKPYQGSSRTYLRNALLLLHLHHPTLSNRHHLLNTQELLVTAAGSLHVCRHESCQTLFFSAPSAQALTCAEVSGQSQQTSWITHYTTLDYQNISLFNSRYRMENRRGTHLGITADQDKKKVNILNAMPQVTVTRKYCNHKILEICDVDHICNACSTPSQQLQLKHSQDRSSVSLTTPNKSVRRHTLKMQNNSVVYHWKHKPEA